MIINWDDPYRDVGRVGGSDIDTVAMPDAVKVPAPQTDVQAKKDAADLVRTNQLIQEGILGAAAKPERIPAAAVTGIQENITALGEVDRAISSLARRPESIGPGTGMLGEMYTQWNDPEGTDVRADVGEIGAVKIHDLSGAAVSASEAPRFTPFVPSTSDQPEAARTKLIKFRERLEQQIREALDYYQPKNGYLPYSTPKIEQYLKTTPAPAQPLREAPPTPLSATAASEGELGQTSTMLNAEDLGTEPRPGGPVVPKDLMELTIDNPPLTATATFDPNDPRRPAPLTKDMTEGMDFTVPDWLKDLGTGTAKTAGTLVETIGDVPGLVANPMIAAHNWATGGNAKADMGENMREAFGLPEWEGGFGEVAKAGLGAFGGAGLATKAAEVATNPSALAAFTTLAKEPIRQTLGAVTGALGSVGAREAGLPWPVQLAANVAGNVAGYGGSKIVAPSRGADPRIAAAARAEDVRISQPMIEGNRKAINQAGTLEANKGTAPIIQEGFARTGEDIEKGVAKLGAGGTASDRVGTGETVRQAAKDIVEGDKRTSKAAYTAAEAIDGDPVIVPTDLVAAIDARIAKLMRRPGMNADAIAELKVYRDDLIPPAVKPKKGQPPAPPKELRLSDLRDMRTDLRETIKGGLTRTSGQKKADAAMMELLDGTNSDIKRTLSPEAWDAWKTADAGYAKSMGYIKDALVPFLGKDFDQLPAEAIADRLNAAAKNNSRALAALYERLPPQKQRDVAATFVDILGRAGPDDPFTTARFVSQARKLSNQSRETLFGASGAESFKNLLVLARRLELAKSQVNVSKTARPVVKAVMQRLGEIFTLGAGGIGLITAGPAGGGAGALAGGAMMGAQAGKRAFDASRLMNPKLTLILADAASARDPASYRDIAIRLGAQIARDPSLKEALEPLQQELEKAGGKKRDINALQAEDTR